MVKKSIDVDNEKWELFGMIAKLKDSKMPEELDKMLNIYFKRNTDLVPKKYEHLLGVNTE